MEIQCQICHHIIQYDESVPRFCLQCGSKLANSPAWPDQSDVVSDRFVQDDDGRWKSDERIPLSPSKIAPLSHLAGPPSEQSAKTVPPMGGTPTVKPNPADKGQTIGPYKLIRWIGSGGMGVVWEAVEISTGRRVALKRLSAEMMADQDYVCRFLREAQLAAQISHPNVTFVYGAGEDKGQPYIAMELMPGHTLGDHVARDGPMPVNLAVDAILNVIDGLIAAHRLGLIHRDIKPTNCFIDSDNTVKIGDFGLSKSMANPEDSNLTKSGMFMGTPTFAPPEQIRGARLDKRTDIYAVAATLFNLLSGRSPFVGDTMSVTAQIISDPAPSVRRFAPKVPKDLDRIIARCLEKDPDRRFQELEKLRVALTPFATRGTSLANLGRRSAAFMVDYLSLQLTAFLITGVYTLYVVANRKDSLRSDVLMELLPHLSFVFGIGTWVLLVLYFAISEGIFGRTFGKSLMGLGVVNGEGESPGLLAGFLRAFAIPGCLGITLIYGILQALYFPQTNDAPGYLIAHIFQLIVWLIPCAICLSTMRESNRMRGLHEIISGTRVVRLETGEARMASIPNATPNLNTIEKLRFGPYETNELLGEFDSGNVYLAHDKHLDRDVWITTSANAAKPSQERINLSRATRQRWLVGGELEDGTHWDAFEPVNGVPILSLVGTGSRIDWEQYRIFLLDVAKELRAASNDGTLPDELTLPQIWIDQNCHAKILDHCLVNVVVGNSRFQPSEETNEAGSHGQAVRLLQELGDLLHRTKMLPLSAQEFLEELQHMRPDPETLDWSIRKLEELSTKTARLNWDTRAGLLGVTIGIEFTIYNLLACGCFLVCFYIAPLPFVWKFPVGLLLSLAIPVVLGYWLRGGIVFRFMEIDVCTKTGRLADRWSCAVRSFFSWLPVLLPAGGVIISSIFVAESLAKIEPIEGTLTYDWMAHPGHARAILGSILISIVLVVFGLIYSLNSPNRGLQDRAAGTRIMPN